MYHVLYTKPSSVAGGTDKDIIVSWAHFVEKLMMYCRLIDSKCADVWGLEEALVYVYTCFHLYLTDQRKENYSKAQAGILVK